MVPDFRISFNDKDATSAIRPYLSKISVRDQDGTELDTATVEMAYDEQISIPDKGSPIKIELGYTDGTYPVFDGVVNAIGVNGLPERLILSATGLALSDDKRLQSNTQRSWNDLTFGEIVTDVIQSAGFKARVHDRLDKIPIRRAMQSIESDLDFLYKLADTFGGVIKSDGDTVAILPARSPESASGKTRTKIKLSRNNELTEFGFTTEYRNYAGTLLASYQADGKTLVTTGGRGSPQKSLKHLYSSLEEADAAIAEEIRRYETRSVFSASMPGRLMPVGSPLEVDGFPDPIKGEFWVRSVTHNFSGSYTIRLEADR